ncbi:uncharacterized protein LOC119113068 [Pollicipes pollicipes]|uniref:uncharacterized protein LOC119113068 n=1 Tax=Pollicipes pollicipes TaxID=41117 RepID=UPI001885610D|nr:uncharacterized protein LOC119113068 [Pollicipes pollicipes]
MRTVAEIPHMHIYQNPDLSAVIPEPDYSDSEEESRPARSSFSGGMASDGALVPRRLSAPLPPAADRQQKLHRELAFNQKIGKNLLGQKSELQRAMERHREQRERRQLQDQLRDNRTSFEIALEERMSRAEPKAQDAAPPSADVTPEFLRVHARMRSKD